MAATPKPVREALLPRSRTLAGFTLRPVTAAHWLWLEEIESPLVKAAHSGSSLAFLDVLAALHILTLDPATLTEPPVKTQIQADARKLAGKIGLSELASVGRFVSEHIASAFVTRPAAGENGASEEDSPFATSKPPKAAAGCSTPSPESARATGGRSGRR